MSIPAARMEGRSATSAILRPVESDLQRVEEVLSAELSSVVRTVVAVSSHILEAGGKRLRPALVVMSARACQGRYDVDRVVRIAAGTELIHMATLMHDDVIDGADSRRGRATANSIWGNQVSVLTGDYMLAKAFSILARDGDTRVTQAVSRATIAMTEGEVSQIESRGDTKALTTYYLSIIHDKTAAFMSACCRLGAILAGASQAIEEALAAYGLSMGMAFQITDDLLDLIGDPLQTGKPVGGDIREGKVTMPIILALEMCSPEDRATMERIIHSGNVTSADVEFARKLVEDAGGIEGTRKAAAKYVGQAIDDLAPLPPSEFRDSLEELAHHVIWRKS